MCQSTLMCICDPAQDAHWQQHTSSGSGQGIGPGPSTETQNPPAYTPSRLDSVERIYNADVKRLEEDLPPSRTAASAPTVNQSPQPNRKRDFIGKLKDVAIGTKGERDAEREKHSAGQHTSEEEERWAYEARLQTMEAKRDAEGEGALPIVANVLGWMPMQTPLESYKRSGKSNGKGNDDGINHN